MCRYCDCKIDGDAAGYLLEKTFNFGILGNEELYAKIFDENLLTFGIGKIEQDIGILYCPMCGRKLNENVKN